VLIDWFTVVAQIVNFLILIFLLKYFLFGRITRAMDKREANIASRHEEAEEKRREAEREAATYQQKNQKLEAERDQLLVQARQEVEVKKKELIQNAREEVEQVQAKWRESIKREKDLFLQELKQRASQQVCTMARRTLKDLANAELEKQIIGVFMERIQSLDEERRRQFVDSIQGGRKGVIIQSAFEIPEEARNQVTQTVRKHIEEGLEVKYQTSPDLLLGIELKADGHKIAWSLENYLESLEANITAALVGGAQEVLQEKNNEEGQEA